MHATERLILRPWTPEDAPAFKAAIDASQADLARFLPWARHEPRPLSDHRERLTRFASDFAAGRSWFYALLDRRTHTLVGGGGLEHLRARALEIGYWIRTGRTGVGLATEAARELTRLALEVHRARAVQIRCDANNAASARIAEKLGFRHRTTIPVKGARPATMIWVKAG